MKPTSVFTYSPALADLVVEGLTEILGEEGLESLLASLPADQAPFHIGHLNQRLVERYGVQSAAGILVRAGRVAFVRMLLKFAADVGFEDQQFRLLAPRRKMLIALQRLADWLRLQGGGEFEVGSAGDYWQWLARADIEGQNDVGLGMACPFLVGMLQELTYWASSGRVHPIHERPHPQGCLLEVEQKPLD